MYLLAVPQHAATHSSTALRATHVCFTSRPACLMHQTTPAPLLFALSLLSPEMQNLLNQLCFPLPCLTRHVPLSACAVLQFPNDGHFFFCWTVLNTLHCPKPRRLEKSPQRISLLKALLIYGLRRLTQKTTTQLSARREVQGCCDLFQRPFFSMTYRKKRSFRIAIL